jgi:hypothetical protein
MNLQKLKEKHEKTAKELSNQPKMSREEMMNQIREHMNPREIKKT